MKHLLLAVLAAGVLSADNIARGKKYTMSALPAKTWEKSLKAIPDYDTILTDGETESGAFFWVSSKCANFIGVQFMDIVVDLGSIEPIGEIAANHGARTASGVFYPSREEYFVSDDGVVFFKAGEYSNAMDPAGLYNADVAKGTFRPHRAQGTHYEDACRGASYLCELGALHVPEARLCLRPLP